MSDINLEAVLLEALDDERKAEATYAAVIEKFGEVRPFINIIDAERRHSAAIERQMTRLNFVIPANHWEGKGAAPATLAEACSMAVDAAVDPVAGACRSSTMTCLPSRENRSARNAPVMPAPTMAISAW